MEIAKPFRAPIGQSDFKLLQDSRATYVDKTKFVSGILGSATVAFLLLRPRRFGKTLNLSTLRYFVERSSTDHSALFEGLTVWQDEVAREHFARHPVIALTFKDVKSATWQGCLESIGSVVAGAYRQHRDVLDTGTMEVAEAAEFEAVLERRASPLQLEESLARLSTWLHRAHGEQVILLIDEYDTPIHTGVASGYYDEVIGFFRTFLSGGLKDNPHLFKGVVTGILRVAKESIFSGLNNLAVYTILRNEFATDFGFTEDEVTALAEASGAGDHVEELRDWYNGYRFGDHVIYNPWSVLNMLASQDRRCEPYWISTGSNELLRGLLTSRGSDEEGEIETLINGGTVEKRVMEDVVLRDLERNPDALWAFLLFSGYLTATHVRYEDEGPRARLSIPNREVRGIYKSVFRQWLAAGVGSESRVRGMLSAVIAGDASTFERHLGELLRNAFSFHDVGGTSPERVYQAFIIGLLVYLEPDYDVRSNRESGYGRADVLLMPRRPGEPGVVLELKVVHEGESPERVMEAAAQQLRDRDYASELRARGAVPVHAMVALFDGKRVTVRSVGVT